MYVIIWTMKSMPKNNIQRIKMKLNIFKKQILV